MMGRPSGASMVAGVIGRPIHHSLSPLLHAAWLDAAGIDGLYAPFSPTEAGFAPFVQGLRGGAIRGLNVTLPFKEAALAAADDASPLATAAKAANLLLFPQDGRIEALNTDGQGLLYAFARQAQSLDLAARAVLILGAGGAARGAVAALIDKGVADIRILNRTPARAQALAADFNGARAFGFDEAAKATEGAGVIINATAAEIAGGELAFDLSLLDRAAVAMDMLYRPVETRFLKAASQVGLKTVDGLDMLIGQAIPSFEALFGRPPPKIDARALLLRALDDQE
jgi:shikimate dehydrogenase